MHKKEMIAMLLAGGQGSRLGILTENKAKPSVSFGGKYKIIDFPLSNCINSGVDTVGIVTQYKPLHLNRHIGTGIPWDLDRNAGGISLLTPYMKQKSGNWFLGTAHAVYSNMNYIMNYNPEYVLILSADHIYKMDYSKMLSFHKENNADVTISVLPVSMEEATRFGILNTDKNGKIESFEEKPEKPKSNLASMGIYIFTWEVLKKALIEVNELYDNSDFGAHVIPRLIKQNKRLFAFRHEDYWKDVGTIHSYWKSNLDLVKTVPEFNLYDKFWKIYTKIEEQSPHYIHSNSEIKSSIIGDGCEIYGEVHNCILGANVLVEEGAYIKDSIILNNTNIGKNSKVIKSIVCESTVIKENASIGNLDNPVPNVENNKLYNSGITVIGDSSTIPANVNIGNNCVIWGTTTYDNYNNFILNSGENIILSS